MSYFNKIKLQGYEGTAWQDVRLDASTHSLQVVDYEHHEIHSGSHYFVNAYANLSINHVLQFTLQTPNTTKWLHWVWEITTEAETLWSVYEGVTVNSALANTITPYNNNRNSANTSGATLKYEDHANLAAANTDIDVSGAILLESGISGAGKSNSGNIKRSSEIILEQNQIYALRAIATSAGYIDFNMQWYEHTDYN